MIRSFSEIPIWLPRSYGGFGDIMVDLKLAEGLRREFPDKDITVYFGNKEDYEKVRKLYPGFDPTQARARLNGICAAHVNASQMEEIMKNCLVGIRSPIPVRPDQEDLHDFVTSAQHNFYIEEYDAREKISLPKGLKLNVPYEDRNGRSHLVLPTGFDEESIGIHIDPALVGLSQELTREKKKELLAKADLESLVGKVPNLLSSEWSLTYYVYPEHFRTDSINHTVLKALIPALKNTGNKKRKVTIFDFSSNTDPDKIERYYSDEPVNDVFFNEFGVRMIGGKGTKFEFGKSNIYVVHLGPRDHSVFLDFLRYSEIPVGITGDASLAEAVSLDKIFIYQSPRWKQHVLRDFTELAPDLLEDWRDADRIMALRGCGRVDEAKVANYPELEEFYLANRENIHKAEELEDQANREGKCLDLSVLDFFKLVLEKQGVDSRKARELKNYYDENKYALSRAHAAKDQGVSDELRALRKRHIFGTNIGIMGDEEDDKLFYDKDFQQSFHRFNRALIDKFDISKNLAKLIRTAVKTH